MITGIELSFNFNLKYLIYLVELPKLILEISTAKLKLELKLTWLKC